MGICLGKQTGELKTEILAQVFCVFKGENKECVNDETFELLLLSLL